jgi:uncharacterized membrane protein YhaH (DUF805 family)
MVKKSQRPVGFIQAVKLAFSQYSDFEGRATRAEFWWYVLFYALVVAIFELFNFVELADDVTLGQILVSIFAIVTLLPSLSIIVRRLRDSGDSWGNVFWLLIPFAGFIILCFFWTRPTWHAPKKAA